MVTFDLSGRPISKFRPDATFGAALDGKQEGQIDRILRTGELALSAVAFWALAMGKLAHNCRSTYCFRGLVSCGTCRAIASLSKSYQEREL
jgi:hypothetical protein